MSAFKEVTVSPHYGVKEAVIRWKVRREFKDKTFVIQKSNDGMVTWKTLGTAKDTLEFKDDRFIVPNREQETHFRVLIQIPGESLISSDAVSTFGTLTRREFGILRKMMIDEQSTAFNQRNGIEVHLLRPKTEGVLCHCVDQVTEQSLGSSLCNNCFGLKYVGGFQDPIKTFLIIIDQAWKLKDNPQGHGTDAEHVHNFRTIAYPELRRGHMYVNAETDERYLVDTFKIFKFAGKVPVTYEGKLEKLRRNDIRYELEID